MNVKNKRNLICVLLLTAAVGAYAQAEAGLSIGTGIGLINNNFTDSGSEAALNYLAPAILADGELAWGNMYMNLAVSVLIFPFSAELGGQQLDLDNYELNYAADLTAIAIGYMLPLNENIKAGGALGFHVASILLSPPGGDPNLLTLEGYYGTIGFSVIPRIRFKLDRNIRCTVSIPVAFDFMPMSDEIAGPGGSTGYNNPAIVAPVTLEPLYTGISAGIYISIGYFFDMPF